VDAAIRPSELLRLRRELAIAQTIVERDTAADERLTAMQMLSEEIKLWVTRCRQLVGMLQVVEMERVNLKAGEGHAKELGTGFKVELEQEDPDSRPPGISEIAAELADTKAKLAVVQAQADDYEARFDTSDSLFDIPEGLSDDELMKDMSRASSPSRARSPFSDTASEHSLSHTNDLHTQLYIAAQKQDKLRRELIFQHHYQQSRLSEYRQESKEYGAKLADLKKKLKVAIAERDSLLRDHTSEQEPSSGGAIQSTETYKALRAEIILANRALEGSQKDHLASHRYYVEKLDHMARYIEDEMAQPEADTAPTGENPPFHRPGPSLDNSDPLQLDLAIPQNPPRPARKSLVNIRSTCLFVLEWTRDTLLSTRMAEIREWSGKHMIYELRERESIGDDALGEDIARFRTKVGLDDTGHSEGGVYRRGRKEWGSRTVMKTKPSRSDGTALPATWARMDQLCKGVTAFPTSLPKFDTIRLTSHGHWPEVTLAIYSWSFYKIHDSTFDDTIESQEFLAGLYRICWQSEKNFSKHFGCQCCAGTDEKTYTRREPIACDPFPTLALRMRFETPEPIDFFDLF
jgi:hypothetical protein